MTVKKKLILAIFQMLGVLAILMFIAFLTFYVIALKDEVQRKDELIKSIQQSDSLFSSKTNEYSKTIKEYIRDCNLQYGNKTISLEAFIRMHNKALDENSRLQDSIIKLIKLNNNLINRNEVMKINYDAMRNNRDTLKGLYYAYLDSTYTRNHIINRIEKEYGIKFLTSRNENTVTYYRDRNISKVDSALMIFEHYKNRLNYDSASKNWEVTLPLQPPWNIFKKKK